MATDSPDTASPASATRPSDSTGAAGAKSSAGAKSASDEVGSLSYEQARDELVRVVNELEQGSSSLEQSLALWERGESLARRCEEWLIGAKARLDQARRAASST